MTLKKILQTLVPEKTKKKLRDQLGVPSQQDSFARIKNLGYRPKQCLDIGAYEGLWTQEFKALFPACKVLMIEGQTERQQKLEKVKDQFEDVDYRIALLGATETTVSFNIYDTASSVLTEHHDTNAIVETRTLTLLDSLIDQANFEPDFIKIDTQGYELQILEGGSKALTSAEFVLLEVSFLDIYKNGPLVNDVLHFMYERGFVVYDICTLMKRPLDRALYQADFLFVKENSSFRMDKRWS